VKLSVRPGLSGSLPSCVSDELYMTAPGTIGQLSNVGVKAHMILVMWKSQSSATVHMLQRGGEGLSEGSPW
jgi:hypothetical protein